MRILFITLVLVIFSQLSAAVSPEIDGQQKQLQYEEKLWANIRIPDGINLQPPTPINARQSGYKQVSLYAKNILFTYVEDLQFDIKKLSALLMPTQQNVPVVLNDIQTFQIDILDGDLVLGTKSLNYIFNRHVLNYAERPLKNVALSTKDNKLIIDTDLRLKSPFPSNWLRARIEGEVSLDDKKRISIEVVSMEVFKLPLAWAMHLLKLNLNQFITLDRPGIALEGRAIKIDLGILPPPKLSGEIHSVTVQKEGLGLIFSSPKKISFDAPPIQSNSYLWLQSGDVRIANMVILNGNMQALSTQADKRVLFNLYDCNEQISQGFLKITPQGEIVAFLPPEFKSAAKSTL